MTSFGDSFGYCSSMNHAGLICTHTCITLCSLYTVEVLVLRIFCRTPGSHHQNCELSPLCFPSPKTLSAYHLIVLMRVLTFKQCDIQCAFKCHSLASNGDIYFICNSEKENTSKYSKETLISKIMGPNNCCPLYFKFEERS